MVETMYKELATGEDGSVIVQDDKPVYLDKDNNQIPVDVPAMYNKIIELNKESKGNRLKAQELQKKFSFLDDIEDVQKWYAEAQKAMETVTNFNEKDWLKADKVESMKRQMKDAHTEEIKGLRASYDNELSQREESIQKKDGQIRQLLVSNNFANCPLFTGDNKPSTMTPDVAEAMFGRHYKVEEVDGRSVVRGYFANGDLVYSRTNPGEPAEFNDAMQQIFDAYPGKDNYIRSKGGGSGAGGGAGDGGKGGEDNDLTRLQRQYDEAVASKNGSLALSLKNRIFELRMKQRKRA